MLLHNLLMPSTSGLTDAHVDQALRLLTELWGLMEVMWCMISLEWAIVVFFKKIWAIPGLFIFVFSSITIFTTIICEKGPSSIRCWDLNPMCPELASLPVTTRPWIPPICGGFGFKHDRFQNYSWSMCALTIRSTDISVKLGSFEKNEFF